MRLRAAHTKLEMQVQSHSDHVYYTRLLIIGLMNVQMCCYYTVGVVTAVWVWSQLCAARILYAACTV